MEIKLLKKLNKMKKIFTLITQIFKKVKINNIGFLFHKSFYTAIVTRIWNFTTFGVLLFLFIARHIIMRLQKSKKLTHTFSIMLIEKIYQKLDNTIEFLNKSEKTNGIHRIELMELVIRNMETKKSRSIITIGGMAVGIAAIVFLVSIGYGLQNVVISRVARLEEMKQIDISAKSGSKIKINNTTIDKFLKINNISEALPLIGVVAKVSYNLSVSDMPAYAVTEKYLKNSAIKPIRGKIFTSNHIAYAYNSNVLGLSDRIQIAEYLDYKEDILFIIHPEQWLKVYLEPTTESQVIGYTRHVPGKQKGQVYYGQFYDDASETLKTKEGKSVSPWIQSDFLLWEKSDCTNTSINCDNGYVIIQDTNNTQKLQKGYIQMTNTQSYKYDPNIETIVSNHILGESTSSSRTKISTPSSLYDVDLESLIASEAGKASTITIKKVKLGQNAYKEAVVNRAMLKVLNIKENDAIGKKISASFVIVGGLIDKNEKIESVQDTYTIIGIVPDDQTPFFYVPLIDILSLGVKNYTQVKLISTDKTNINSIRKKIEAMGFETASVVDTVEQINNLFSSVRVLLALLGTLALAVAALGMFNTLTVSLLERTHEVGLMKAMGMKSYEVQELFLTESMVMGFTGGLFGLIIGFVIGKLLGLVLSLFTIFKGVGYLDISYIPIEFVFVIIFLSLMVGFFTGIYPAHRAKNISALDALRYE